MNWYRPLHRNGTVLVLTALLIPPPAMAQPKADVRLNTELNRMSVRIDQGAPLPPGGCQSGYAWHTTYGGCRRQEAVTESAPCPTGQTGSRTRQRTAYILQADARNIAHGPWEPWRDTCQRPRAQGVMDQVIVRATSAAFFAPPESPQLIKSFSSDKRKGIVRAMRAADGKSVFGITLDRSSAKLHCVYSSYIDVASGDGTAYGGWWVNIGLPGQSVNAGYGGNCTLHESGTAATVYGNCNEVGGGEAGDCQGAAFLVHIIDVTGCTVTVEAKPTRPGDPFLPVERPRHHRFVRHYDICV